MSKKVHLIMPMGGGGTRFGNKGFNLPKPLIELQGKPFFYWATQSIVKFMEVKDITFVVLKEHIERFDIVNRINEYYPDAKIQIVPEVLNGAVLTCMEGIKVIEDDLPILFNDCDHAFICNSFYDFCKIAEFNQMDGAMLTFESNDSKYSFLEFDSTGNVCRTVEKQAISNEAICGAYYFRNRDIFKTAVEKYLIECSYSEFFVSGVYNEMANRGDIIKSFRVDEHISFGTPDEYDDAVTDSRLEALL
ncbi:sugar phosphate nucleotidyltransferase [Clostridium sp. CMCC3677]|uniref:sugar phosphate nucleotidyltransferase n=1 Tax=Clostridium sp. CMCC3677 TaxID=2949963 RepID=UPI0013F02919|nr:sugar phosphate nucleotidyltransferase [Clostridium sp. CMCC3677]NFG60726.1 dolichyl-phosphate mannose synthase [Clostridium botulinum]NFQ08160.1 dolichyl-phosphate mannose synthase [Clostridium botulinum]